MSPADGGFVRLDRRSGAVSFCSMEGGALTCRAGADERAALQNEIDRLAAENDRLKGPSGSIAPREGSSSELDRLGGIVQDTYRRFMEIMRRVGEEFERKT